MDTGTDGCAAAWVRASGRHADATSSSLGLATSISSRSTPRVKFDALPVDRSSTTSTSSPLASSRSTMWEPTKPAPPVTMTRIRHPRSVVAKYSPPVLSGQRGEPKVFLIRSDRCRNIYKDGEWTQTEAIFWFQHASAWSMMPGAKRLSSVGVEPPHRVTRGVAAPRAQAPPPPR